MRTRGGSRSAHLSRRRLLAAASRAGVGAVALALAGCGPDRDFSRPPPSADRAEQDQQEQQPGASGGAARSPLAPRASTSQSDTAAAPAEAPVDPIEWRERYHWRRLATAPLSEFGPQQGGVLQLAASSAFEWSPYSVFATPLLPLVYSQIVALGAGDGIDASVREFEGDLAARWETPDPLTVAFTLRDGPVWPNRAPVSGREIVAGDVKAALDSFRMPGQFQTTDFAAIERVDADDGGGTVSLHLSEPAAYLLAEISRPRHVVVPPELIAEPSLIDWQRMSRGSGPFFVSASKYAAWSVTRNPEYFGASDADMTVPHVDRITNADGVGREGLAATDRSALHAEWRRGALDQYALQSPSELEEAMLAHPDSVALVTAPTPGAGPSFRYDPLERAPFNDVRVRRAISMSLDRAALANALYGGLAAPDCGLDWTFAADAESDREFREWPWTVEELGPAHQHDPGAAVNLLSAAGYSAERPIELRIDAPSADVDEDFDYAMRIHCAAAEAVRAQLSASLSGSAQVLLEPRSRRDDADSRFTDFWSFEAGPRANVIYEPSVRAGDSVDVDDLTYSSMHSRGRQFAWYWAGINDPEIDRLCEAQRHELAPLRRSEILEQIRLREADQAWRLFLVNPYGLSVRREYVFNLSSTYFAKEVEGAPKQLQSTWLFQS